MRVEMRSEHIVGQACPIRSHGVFRINHPNRHGIAVTALVAHHAHAADRQENGESLPRLLVKAGAANFLHYDGIGVAKGFQALGGNFAQQSHRQPRPRERMLGQDLFGQSQFAADAANFVLEKLAQRLDQFERQIRRQAADVVMRL